MTEQNTTTLAITEEWKPAEYQMRTSVKLKGAPDIRSKGQAYSPYSLTLEFRRVNDGPWFTAWVTIYASKRYAHGETALVGSCLHPSKLDEMPGWLTDIIERAAPKAG